MNTKVTLAAAVALIALGASAAAPVSAKSPLAPKPNECFWTRNVDSFAAENDHIVNVRVGVGDIYQFEIMGSCPDIDWNQRIALVSRGGDSICSGMDAEIVTRSQIGPQRCPVHSVRKLTPEEVAALPPKARP